MSQNQVENESSFIRSLRSRFESFRRTLYFLTRSPLAVAGLTVTIIYIMVAIFGDFFVTGNPWVMNQYLVFHGMYIYNVPQPPSKYFPFGTTYGGYDIFNGVIKGARLDEGVAAAIVLSGALTGIVLGSIAGYFGGILDDVIMRITDIFLSIPGLVLLIAFMAILGRKLDILVFGFIVIWWPTYTRIIRGQVLSLREMKYVEAAKAAGAGGGRIILRHLIPNAIYPIFVQISLDFGNVILTLATLDYLGFGFAGQNLAEWGNIIGLATRGAGGVLSITLYPWTITIPGLIILAFVLSLNFLGDGLRDVLDPRMRR